MSGPRQHPHGGRPLTVSGRGEKLEAARGAVVMLHGRGDSARGILGLADPLWLPGLAYVAPEAAGQTWYPRSFLSPIADNEPFLSSALAAVGEALATVAGAGIPPERTALLGFSQGACLASEFAARNAKRYGAVVAFSGGLIGPDGTPRDYPGTLSGTPVFLGCSDVDPHIPRARVEESAGVLEKLGGAVTARIYPGMGHTVNEDEIEIVRGLLAALAGP